jgi:Helix-turn-helix domain
MATKGVSIGQACRLLGVSADELRAMMADGRLRYRRVNSRPGKPSHIVIRSSDIDAVLKRSSAASMEDALLPNTRMREIARGSNIMRRRTEFLQSWTGQDHRPAVPEPDAEGPMTFGRICKYARPF